MNGNTQSSMSPPTSPSAPLLPRSKRTVLLWIILVAAAVVATGVLLYFILLPQEAGGPTSVPMPKSDDLSAIEGELQGVDFGGLDSELEQIDQELQGL